MNYYLVLSRPVMTDMSMVNLVKQAIADPQQFAKIVELYEAKLLRYICRFTGLDHQSGEDILQEVFIKMYRNLNSFDPSLQFSSWAYRIAHNEALNYLRDNKHHKSVMPLENDEEDAVNLIDVLASEIDIPRDVKRSELAESVRVTLQNMPDDYKEVLILRFLEDKDYAEISDIIKKPMGTVATLLNRAKEHFKKVYSLHAHE